MIKDNELPENCNEIWDKVSEVIKKGFDSQPVYNEKYLKTKINYYEGKVLERRFWKNVNTLLKVNRHIIEDIEISYDADESYEE